jgi:V8-like Glu-specific endopeptidase
MAWSKKLTQLNDVLGELVPDKTGIHRYVRASGLKIQHINMDGSPVDAWSNVLSEADKNSRVDDLVNAVLDSYPDNPFLKSALATDEINYSLSPDIDKISNWEPVSDDTLEVLTMGFNTLLPVSFLDLGVVRSKAVAKVEIKISTHGYNVGTGFLCKIENFEDLFFLTNYHVINDKKWISNTRIIFNYEMDINGDSKASKSFKIDGMGPWYTSPVAENDVCIFKLDATEEDLKDYRHLLLKKIEVSKNDFVNIIQHPGGEMKQISIYHNIITSTNENRVQYLTDTLKGSSGSPVFNSNWEVVALHHSGGLKQQNEPELPPGIKSRNEGIHINKIIAFLMANHK